MNVDAVLLAWFAGLERRAEYAVDLGAGVGAVALSLLYRDRVARVLLVERDPRLSKLAVTNLAANGWGARGVVLEGAVESATAPGPPCDLVVCNPPYVPPGRGRVPIVGEAARMGTLAAFVRAARRLLGPRGRACFVYPASELATIVGELRDTGLEPKRLCFVHARADVPARVVLVEGQPAKRGGLVVLPPFVERIDDAPSALLDALLAPA